MDEWMKFSMFEINEKVIIAVCISKKNGNTFHCILKRFKISSSKKKIKDVVSIF